MNRQDTGYIPLYLDKLSQGAHISSHDSPSRHTHGKACILPDISHIGIKSNLSFDRNLQPGNMNTTEFQNVMSPTTIGPPTGINGEINPVIMKKMFQVSMNYQNEIRKIDRKLEHRPFVDVGQSKVDKLMAQTLKQHEETNEHIKSKYQQTKELIDAMTSSGYVEDKKDIKKSSKTRKMVKGSTVPISSHKTYNRLSLFKTLLIESVDDNNQ